MQFRWLFVWILQEESSLPPFVKVCAFMASRESLYFLTLLRWNHQNNHVKLDCSTQWPVYVVPVSWMLPCLRNAFRVLSSLFVCQVIGRAVGLSAQTKAPSRGLHLMVFRQRRCWSFTDDVVRLTLGNKIQLHEGSICRCHDHSCAYITSHISICINDLSS